jgi:uroporphyrinogen decarboxylase
MVEIAEYLKEKYPHIPVIMFPKGVAAFIERGLFMETLMYLE